MIHWVPKWYKKMSSKCSDKNKTKSRTRKVRRPGVRLVSVSAVPTGRRQDQPSSPAAALFSVGFFLRRLGNYCPTSTWWTSSGSHSSGKHSVFLEVNDAGQRGSGSHSSMTEHVTHSHSHRFAFIPLSPLPPPSPFCLPDLVCASLFYPFTISQGGKYERRKGGERKERKKVRRKNKQ